MGTMTLSEQLLTIICLLALIFPLVALFVSAITGEDVLEMIQQMFFRGRNKR